MALQFKLNRKEKGHKNSRKFTLLAIRWNSLKTKSGMKTRRLFIAWAFVSFIFISKFLAVVKTSTFREVLCSWDDVTRMNTGRDFPALLYYNYITEILGSRWKEFAAERHRIVSKFCLEKPSRRTEGKKKRTIKTKRYTIQQRGCGVRKFTKNYETWNKNETN